MTRIIRKIRRVFTNTPDRGFTWTVEDFERAKSWAKSVDYPENPSISLWDHVYSIRKESAEILHELNSFLEE